MIETRSARRGWGHRRMIEHARGVVTSGIASSSVCVCVYVCHVCACTRLFLSSDTMNERTNSTSDSNDASTSRESALGVGRGADVRFQGCEDLSQGVVGRVRVGGEKSAATTPFAP